MRLRWILWVGLGIGCAQELPSLVPLGRGPQAEEEKPAGPRKAQKGPRQSAANRPPARAEASRDRADASDAGADASPADASPADASPADASPADAATADGALPSKDKDPAPQILAGRYQGPDVTVTRVEGWPERSEKDPNAKTDVEQKSKTKLAITLINSVDGTPICTLDAELQDSALATLPAGQPCFGGDHTTATLTSGTAKFAGPKLTLDLRLDLEIELEDEHREGHIDYRFDGVRK